jgi:hypothetical protein
MQSTTGLLGLTLVGLLLTGISVTGVGGAAAFAGQGACNEGNGEGEGEGGTDREGEDQGPFGPDEEAVGTLPIKGRDRGPLVLPRSPGIYLRGSEEAVRGTVLAADGDGFVLEGEITETGEYQLTFHGEVELELDAGLLQVAGVQAGLVSTDPVHATQAAALTEHSLLLRARMGVGELLELPLGDYEQSGVLDGEGVRVLTASPLTGRDWMQVHALGGVIRLRQAGPLGL